MALIEIAADSLESALAAEQGGAHRIELCTALREGGLTASLGLIRQVRSRVSLELLLLLRPRAGDFLYSQEELEVLCEDLRIAQQEGAEGVVFGFLTPDGDVDEERTREVVEAARPLKVTFHRAFDMTRDRATALQALLRCGADRVLTSGGAPTALEGAKSLHDLVHLAGESIDVVIGGGVRPHNIAELARLTGGKQFHSSLSETEQSAMRYRQNDIHMGTQGEEEYVRRIVSVDNARALVRASASVVDRFTTPE